MNEEGTDANRQEGRIKLEITRISRTPKDNLTEEERKTLELNQHVWREYVMKNSH